MKLKKDAGEDDDVMVSAYLMRRWFTTYKYKFNSGIFNIRHSSRCLGLYDQLLFKQDGHAVEFPRQGSSFVYHRDWLLYTEVHPRPCPPKCEPNPIPRPSAPSPPYVMK